MAWAELGLEPAIDLHGSAQVAPSADLRFDPGAPRQPFAGELLKPNAAGREWLVRVLPVLALGVPVRARPPSNVVASRPCLQKRP